MSVRKAQTDFFSPMTGNVFRDNKRRANLIMEAAKVDLIKTDDPFTQIAERKSYAPQEDPASISDAFDKEYGVLSDEEAVKILEENKKIVEEPTPVINPDPIPTPIPTPEPKPESKTENTPEKAVEKDTEYKKKGREAFMGNSARTMRLRANAQRKAKQAGRLGGGGSASRGVVHHHQVEVVQQEEEEQEVVQLVEEVQVVKVEQELDGVARVEEEQEVDLLEVEEQVVRAVFQEVVEEEE